MTPSRLNKFIARATGLSRRQADQIISEHRIKVNGQAAQIGQPVCAGDTVQLDGTELRLPAKRTLLLLNKPIGYVCSRRAQAENVQTVYRLLPPQYQALKTVGRLDKDSSGLILLTDDGDLAQLLTHPRHAKQKQYQIQLDRPLSLVHQQMINDFGLELADGLSRLTLSQLSPDRTCWQVTMSEGRNRQIRRTFSALGYQTIRLHRTEFGDYDLPDDLPAGKWRQIE